GWVAESSKKGHPPLDGVLGEVFWGELEAPTASLTSVSVGVCYNSYALPAFARRRRLKQSPNSGGGNSSPLFYPHRRGSQTGPSRASQEYQYFSMGPLPALKGSHSGLVDGTHRGRIGGDIVNTHADATSPLPSPDLGAVCTGPSYRFAIEP